MPSITDPDGILLLRYGETGDPSAFEALVRKHTAGALRVAERVVGRPDLAEDVVQETWARLAASARAFRGDCSFRTYFFTVLHNVSRTRRAQEARATGDTMPMPADPGGEAAPEEPAFAPAGMTPPPTPLDAAIRREEASTLEKSLASLSEDDREIIALVYLGEMQVKQAAEAIGLAHDAARARLHRALERLRTHLRRD
jgi:RNA polymerase sigma-70 factor (ECF subfamily)